MHDLRKWTSTLRTVHFGSSGPSNLAHRDRPLWTALDFLVLLIEDMALNKIKLSKKLEHMLKKISDFVHMFDMATV